MVYSMPSLNHIMATLKDRQYKHEYKDPIVFFLELGMEFACRCFGKQFFRLRSLNEGASAELGWWVLICLLADSNMVWWLTRAKLFSWVKSWVTSSKKVLFVI